MKILAIHDGHNASACLLRDGTMTHWLQEERLVGIKNQPGVPIRAIDHILTDAGLTPDALDAVALGQWEHSNVPSEADPFGATDVRVRNTSPLRWQWTQWRNDLLKRWGWYEPLKWRYGRQRMAGIFRALPGLPEDRLKIYDHHLCHAAAAYWGAPWRDEPVLVLTQDGGGDGRCASVYVGAEGKLRCLSSTPVGNSIGDIYLRVTREMGMKPREHEYKLMGMAPYAEKARAERMADRFLRYLTVEGMSFRHLTPEPTCFTWDRIYRDMRMVRFDVVAAGVQLFCERLMLQWVQNCIAATGIRKLACAGGTFMNVKANGLIAQLPEVDGLWVCPSSGDESLPYGAGALAHLEAGGAGASVAPMAGLYLGQDIESAAVEGAIDQLQGVRVERGANLPERVAELLAEGEIVARCAGRCEFGARALGNRSIFADPSRSDSVRVLNQMIKMRDFWMPFAPILMRDRQGDYLVNPKDLPSPYMMVGFPTKPEAFEAMLCAVQPADRSARPELLEPGWNPPVERMLRAFEETTGRAVVLNTSYNIHGEPMVGTVEQGISTFLRSGLRWLWLGDTLLRKESA